MEWYTEPFPYVIMCMNGKENVVADALSRKIMLLQKFEINVTWFNHIKDLYAIDPFFAKPFAHAKKALVGYLMHVNKLCVP